jgi:hypothetical protein
MINIDSKIANLSKRIDLLTNKVDKITVTGGAGILVKEAGSAFIVSQNNQSPPTNTPPWTLIPTLTQKGEKTYVIWSTYGGMINNLLGENFDEIIEYEATDNQVRHVYWHVKLSYLGIDSFKIEVTDDEKLPMTENILYKNSLPIDMYGLIGTIVGDEVSYQYIHSNLEIKFNQELAIENEDGVMDYYYRYSVHELTPVMV